MLQLFENSLFCLSLLSLVSKCREQMSEANGRRTWTSSLRSLKKRAAGGRLFCFGVPPSRQRSPEFVPFQLHLCLAGKKTAGWCCASVRLHSGRHQRRPDCRHFIGECRRANNLRRKARLRCLLPAFQPQHPVKVRAPRSPSRRDPPKPVPPDGGPDALQGVCKELRLCWPSPFSQSGTCGNSGRANHCLTSPRACHSVSVSGSASARRRAPQPLALASPKPGVTSQIRLASRRRAPPCLQRSHPCAGTGAGAVLGSQPLCIRLRFGRRGPPKTTSLLAQTVRFGVLSS